MAACRRLLAGVLVLLGKSRGRLLAHAEFSYPARSPNPKPSRGLGFRVCRGFREFRGFRGFWGLRGSRVKGPKPKPLADFVFGELLSIR